MATLSGLDVKPSDAVSQYQPGNINLQKIGDELNVTHVVSGSYAYNEPVLQVIYELIELSTIKTIRADTKTQEVSNAAHIYTVQNNITRQIAEDLKVSISPEEAKRIEKEPTQSLQALDYYLKGQEYYEELSNESNEKAINLFRKALEIDEGFALAYAGLGAAYYRRTLYGSEVTGDSSMIFARKALEIDPELSEGYKALGNAFDHKEEYRKAMKAYKRAVEPLLSLILMSSGARS